MRAARLHKVVPVLALPAIAALMVRARVPTVPIAISTLAIFVVGALGMKLNVQTDRALDQRSKPNLHAARAADPTLWRKLIWIEGIAYAALVLWLATWSLQGAAFLVLVGALSILYSFNFLAPRHAELWRLKVFWWGNALSIGGAYFAIWLLGFHLGGVDLLAYDHRAWLGAGAAFTCFDYAVFLNECALDAEDEREHMPQTLNALVGQRGVALVSIAVWMLGSVIALSVCVARDMEAVVQVSLLSSAGLSVAACLSFLSRHAEPEVPGALRRLRERWIDRYFVTERAVLLVVVVIARWGMTHG